MDKGQLAQLGTYINQTRQEAGLSLRRVADAAGISPSSLSDIENGRRLAQPETLTRIAAALKIDFEDLYSLAGYGRPESLPSFSPYLRSKYGDQLPPEKLAELERFFENITKEAETEDA